MRDLRSINKVNEDNKDGMHSNTVVTNFDRQVTGGNDAPEKVTKHQLEDSVEKAKETLLGKKDRNMSNTDDNNIINIDSHDVNIDQSVHHSSLGDGLAWFDMHWKEIAIVVGAAALITAIAKLVKALDKSIKVRYNKVVKTLQKAQKDFTTAPDGLNMKSVLPGIGSKINDWLSRLWTWNWGSSKNRTGNIGLHPFCAQYINEIRKDFALAQTAFGKIKLGSDESNVDKDRNTNRSADRETFGESASNTYSSFREAYSEDLINEGVEPEKIDESLIAAISVGMGLASFAVRAGQFLFQRYNKNGHPVGEPKKIQITKESTREICYAIINNFADKYVNMKQVFKELGINSNSLADIDASACDKLIEILKKYQKPEANSYTKQYSRIEKAYKKMLTHYFNIGDGIIANFVKYSSAKDEKHANLIIASKEKLENMWDSQKDFYESNFSHVLIEIVSSEPYIKYLEFIIDKVIPVFKSGLASDADYILDIVPKHGEYYLLRQTGNGQAVIDDEEKVKGNVAIAEVLDFNRDEKKIKFTLIGLVKGGKESKYTLGEEGMATLSDDVKIDYSAYKGNDEFTEDYSKWLSLDPVVLDWNPEQYTNVKAESVLYERDSKTNRGREIHEYMFAVIEVNDESINVVTTDKLNEDGEESATGDETKEVTSNDTAEENKVVEPGTDIAKKNLVKTIFICNIDKNSGKTIFDEVSENKFDGSSIEIDPACNINEVDKKAEELGFAKVENNQKQIKQIILSNILKQNGSVQKAYSGKFNIDQLGDGIKEIENREGSADKLMLDAGEIAQKIVDDYNKLDIKDESAFKAKPSKFADYNKGINVSGILYQRYLSDDKNDGKKCIVEDTGIQIDGKEENIKLYVYPTLTKDKNDKNGKYVVPSVIIYCNQDAWVNVQIGENIKNVVEDAIISICNALINHKHIEVSRIYGDAVKDVNAGDNIEDKVKADVESLFKIVKEGKDASTNSIMFDVKANKDGNVEIINPKNAGLSRSIEFKFTDVEIFVVITIKDNGKLSIQTRYKNGSVYPKEDIDITKIKEYLVQIIMYCINHSPSNTQGNESVNISYSFDSNVNESIYTSTVNVNRKFDKRMAKNWYVLSEAVYDDGTGRVSNIDNPKFVNKLLERSDCASFAKSSRLAKFMPYDINQKYSLVSEKMYSPSVATPLYESVVLVKLDKMDNIVEKNYLGKYKIG